MSVKQHEAFCFDSFQDMLLFFDDFHGDQLQDEWLAAGTGSAVVVDQQTGGIVRLTTGATTNNNYLMYWQDIRSLHVDQRVSFESRLKLAQTSAEFVYVGIRFDFNNMVVFWYETGLGHTNWYITTRDGGVGVLSNSGIAVDTDYHIFRIECFPTGQVHFYIDGTEVANSPSTVNIPDDATDFLQPYFRILTEEDVAKIMDIDYCYIRQDR